MKKVLEYRIGRSGDGVTRYILGNYARVDKEKIHMDFVTGDRDLFFLPGSDRGGMRRVFPSRLALQESFPLPQG